MLIYFSFVFLMICGCSTTKAPGESLGMTNPTFSDRLEKVFNPPWWYHGPVKMAYDQLFPPPWYQGSLEWMYGAVTEICDAKVDAMARASTIAVVSTALAPSPVSVVMGVVRVVSTGGVVTYCRLKE